MMDSEEEEEQTALVCDNGKFWVKLPIENLIGKNGHFSQKRLLIEIFKSIKNDHISRE